MIVGEITFLLERGFVVMVFLRSVSLVAVFFIGIALALPLKAQTVATLNVSARVVEECTVRSKRELFRLARRLNDASIIARCSKGVVSRVNTRVVTVPNLQPSVVPISRTTSRTVKRTNSAGNIDVMLVTVSY